MRKIPAVEEAKTLMTEGIGWGVWKWLAEKKRVRAAADKANETLDEVENKIKETWSDALKDAYNVLVEKGAKRSKSKPNENGIDPKIMQIAKAVFEADDVAERAHQEAEDTFDEAERRLSTSMAKDGARKAIESWDLHEAAIRKAEAAAEFRNAAKRSE
jgi:hypothetical protein